MMGTKQSIITELDKAISIAEAIAKNCGCGESGAPGFQPGHACSRRNKPIAGDPPSPGMAAPTPHSVDLPSNRRRLNTESAREALEEMGYRVSLPITGLSNGKFQTSYTIHDADGNSVTMSAREIGDFIYANHQKK